jgi:hypothetical protein
MKMRRIALSMGLAALGFGCLVLTASCLGATANATGDTACVPFDPTKPDDAFVIVSEVYERRCGTLDCHGQPSRPLRIYGNSGLRRPEPDLGTEKCETDKDCPPGPGRVCKKGIGCIDATINDYAQYYAGGGVGTTPSERLENWMSICGLEPELFTIVFCCSAGKDRCQGFDYATLCAKPENYDVERLTLVRKARNREKHKGGLIWNKGQPGDACTTNWITDVYDKPGADTSDCSDELQHL